MRIQRYKHSITSVRGSIAQGNVMITHFVAPPARTAIVVSQPFWTVGSVRTAGNLRPSSQKPGMKLYVSIMLNQLLLFACSFDMNCSGWGSSQPPSQLRNADESKTYTARPILAPLAAPE